MSIELQLSRKSSAIAGRNLRVGETHLAVDDSSFESQASQSLHLQLFEFFLRSSSIVIDRRSEEENSLQSDTIEADVRRCEVEARDEEMQKGGRRER